MTLSSQSHLWRLSFWIKGEGREIENSVSVIDCIHVVRLRRCHVRKPQRV